LGLKVRVAKIGNLLEAAAKRSRVKSEPHGEGVPEVGGGLGKAGSPEVGLVNGTLSEPEETRDETFSGDLG